MKSGMNDYLAKPGEQTANERKITKNIKNKI